MWHRTISFLIVPSKLNNTFIKTNILSQRACDAIMMLLWRQNDVAASFWRHNNVSIASWVGWSYNNITQQTKYRLQVTWNYIIRSGTLAASTFFKRSYRSQPQANIPQRWWGQQGHRLYMPCILVYCNVLHWFFLQFNSSPTLRDISLWSQHEGHLVWNMIWYDFNKVTVTEYNFNTSPRLLSQMLAIRSIRQSQHFIPILLLAHVLVLQTIPTRLDEISHWVLGNVVAILQTTLWNTFSSMKFCVYWCV